MTDSEFERQLEPCRPRIYRICLRFFPDSETAKDLAQEAALRAFQFRHRYRSDQGEFAAWIRQVTWRVCLSAMRRRNREVPIYEGADFERLELEPDAGCSPLDVVLNAEQQETARRYLDDLSDADRLIMVLRASGNTWAQISEAVRLPAGTCRSRYERALSTLRRRAESEEA